MALVASKKVAKVRKYFEISVSLKFIIMLTGKVL